MATAITPERPDTPDARVLIAELDAHLAPLYPRESCHGYSVDELIGQGVLFFVIRSEGTPVGCGGIQIVGADYGELKRMYVRPAYRGHGHARLMLTHLAGLARDRGVTRLRLETGIHQTAAIALYERAGFQRIPAFGGYKPDPLSLFYEKQL